MARNPIVESPKFGGNPFLNKWHMMQTGYTLRSANTNQ